jgi:hypothetical protein
MTKIAEFGSESESGSICQSHGSADPDPDPNTHQNVIEPQQRPPGKKTLGYSSPGGKQKID